MVDAGHSKRMVAASLAAAGTDADANATPAIILFIAFSIATFLEAGWRAAMSVDKVESRE
ncbi:MAG TPA: hypothetical protein VF470_10610 [Sphingomicrobium sp.]